ncbi:Catalase A [Grifola frondosa]|uniref:catalase n=1 Tax=Grifola frondosa TaxID=5627 RepID=A0A1C7MSK0_GRIFR|nr:Catalase A [Grifola frondosa]
MSDPTFAQFYPQAAAFDYNDAAAFAVDPIDYHKQNFDLFNFGQGIVSDVLAPHPDQFESELDSLAFDQELNVIPVETGDFTLFRSDTPTFGPFSSFTVSSESVSGYGSTYADSISSHSESFYNFNGQSPTSNYAASAYSLTHEQLDMDFQRLRMPAEDDPNSFGTLPSSPSIRSSPGNVPNISHYSPEYSSRGSFSDYEPAQPQQVRIGSSAASDYYPQVQVQLNKYSAGPGVVGQATVAPDNVSPQLPAVPPMPSVNSQRPAKMESIHDDPKRKYRCPSCPRAFARQYNLKTHIQTHDPNRSKPYACHHKSCGRSFSRKHDLTRHLVSIHRAESVASMASGRSIGVDSGSRNWCEDCGKGWVGKDRLQPFHNFSFFTPTNVGRLNMSSAIGTVKQTFASMTGHTAKVADLQNNIIDPAKKPTKGQTTDHGVFISDPDNWLKVTDGTRPGPSLLEDQRVVHARGAGAHGYFKVYDNSASKYTYAPVLTDPSRITPVFTRFSTVQGSRGSADTVRDVRGFAVKFYTQEGNWDIVGNDIPVFFIQDAIKFPDFVHAVKPEPHNEVPQGQSAHNNFWDFVGLQPESAHMIMWVMSDRGIPRSYRMMQGFGVNTYTLMNAKGERFFVKFHWLPELGVHSLMWDEALKICGQDPDFHRKDLEEAIMNGSPPKWKFAIQTIPEASEDDFDFDILDATKTVDEYFPETEQVAFCTSHVVPGIGFSDDPLLQGRNFSYFDTQISRLGVNWQELPINRPLCPVMNNQRDGQMRHKITKGEINYWPNRQQLHAPVSAIDGGYAEFPQKVQGIKQRLRSKKFLEHFNQAQLFYNSLTKYEKAHLVSAISFELSHCDDPVVYESYTKILNNIDHNLARQVAINVGGVVPEKPARENHGFSSPTLSQLYYSPDEPTIASRRIAILLADGFNLAEVESIRAALKAGGATTWIIGPRRGQVYPAGQAVGTGKGLWADHHYEGQRSTLFDAFIIPSGAEHAQKLVESGRVIHWMREAFGHCKAIGALGEGAVFLREAVGLPGVQFATNLGSDAVTSSYGIVTVGRYDAGSTAADTLKIAQGEKGFVSNFAFEVSKHRCYERELDGLTSKVAF